MEKKKIDFRLEAKKNSKNKTVDVYIYGDIVDDRPVDFWTGEEIAGDFIIPGEVRKLLSEIEEEKISIHINSYGGSIFASVSIFNYIKSLQKEITMYVDGLAASGASLIALAGSKLVMPKNTVMMIHRASSAAWGNCNNLREVANTLEKLDDSTVFETYKWKFKGSDDELKELIDSETWITAEEAFSYGLCDEVIEINEDPDQKKPSEKEIENAKKFITNFAKLKI